MQSIGTAVTQIGRQLCDSMHCTFCDLAQLNQDSDTWPSHYKPEVRLRRLLLRPPRLPRTAYISLVSYLCKELRFCCTVTNGRIIYLGGDVGHFSFYECMFVVLESDTPSLAASRELIHFVCCLLTIDSAFATKYIFEG